MGEINFAELLQQVKAFSDSIVGPVVLFLIPAIVTAYFKLRKGIEKVKERIKKGWSEKLRDWDAEFSRRTLKEIGFFIDGIHGNPYCRADQIVYINLENGIVGPSNIHSMFFSVQTESTGVSRCQPKATLIQRVPYVEMSLWSHKMEEEGILRIENVAESPFKDLKIHADAKSAIVIPVFTKENYLAGMVVFNYFDEHWNFQESTEKCEELIRSIKAFIEGQFLHKEMARQDWIETHHH